MATDRNLHPQGPVRERRQVFVESGVILIDEANDDRRQEVRRVLASGAADAVTLLAEAHDVSVVDANGADASAIDGLPAVPWVAALPASFRAGAWYLTADDSWCDGDRPSGLQSILVGLRRPPGPRPTARCDLEARDLNAAVMEILVRETMA
jgi:hypothetical protein